MKLSFMSGILFEKDGGVHSEAWQLMKNEVKLKVNCTIKEIENPSER